MKCPCYMPALCDTALSSSSTFTNNLPTHPFLHAASLWHCYGQHPVEPSYSVWSLWFWVSVIDRSHGWRFCSAPSQRKDRFGFCACFLVDVREEKRVEIHLCDKSQSLQLEPLWQQKKSVFSSCLLVHDLCIHGKTNVLCDIKTESLRKNLKMLFTFLLKFSVMSQQESKIIKVCNAV